MDPIVITTQEVAQAQIPVQAAPEIRPKVPNPVPIWARLLLAPLVLVLPLLCLAALVLRVSVRGQPPRPTLPASKVMSSVELSSTLKPLVLMASPAAKRWFQQSYGTSGLLGAALILHADSHGYLLATARHVADGEGWRGRSGVQQVMVSVGMNGWAAAQVVGRHKRFDVALLWLERRFGDSGEFTQPVATYNSVQMGERIFVIGHPEGLNFSVSNGIVSRTPGNDVLQVSAPISPGNSGGPVYDEYGNLLGIVTSKVARSMEPEAENLNFAVSTDALLHEADWEIVTGGTAPKNLLSDFVHRAKVRRGPADAVAAR